jgi:hypothetical protein
VNLQKGTPRICARRTAVRRAVHTAPTPTARAASSHSAGAARAKCSARLSGAGGGDLSRTMVWYPDTRSARRSAVSSSAVFTYGTHTPNKLAACLTVGLVRTASPSANCAAKPALWLGVRGAWAILRPGYGDCSGGIFRIKEHSALLWLGAQVRQSLVRTDSDRRTPSLDPM